MRTAQLFGDLLPRQSEVMAVFTVLSLLPVVVVAIVLEAHFNAIELSCTIMIENATRGDAVRR